MARKRMIDPAIWQSEDMSKISVFARYVWVGLFSNADDEGRGRAKAAYIKSIVFPYDEEITVKMVDDALSEVAKYMSITFYKENENEFYQLEKWDKFQRVDRPQPSQLPAVQDNSMIIRRAIGEQSASNRRAVPPNIKEDSIREDSIKEKKENAHMRDPSLKKFQQPTLEEVSDYCKERNNNISPQQFIDFYISKGWKVGKEPMKDWKAAVRTWESRLSQDNKQKQKDNKALNYPQNDYSAEKLNAVFANLDEQFPDEDAL